MDYSDKEKDSEYCYQVNEKLVSPLEIQSLETRLEPRVAKFISLICNVSMMKQQMMEIGYNAEKLPLGKEDPLYSHYQRLHTELTPVEVSSEEFSMVVKYMENTHAKTHSNYSVDIVQLFKVSREGEAERFRKFSSTKNRMLLWHGSRLTNWTGILSQGLRIAPPEAPVTGYMFGKGVYFADMFSNSANYCYASHATTTGVMLLCEVALGDMVELSTAKHDADKLPEGKLSTKGVGSTAPDPSQAQALEDGIIVPFGKPKAQSGGPKACLLYNEYIVYNVDQIRMRYVVQVNFNFKGDDH